jgi:hypothetical protein
LIFEVGHLSVILKCLSIHLIPIPPTLVFDEVTQLPIVVVGALYVIIGLVIEA